MSTTTKIIRGKLREALRQEKAGSFKERARKAEDAAMKDLDDKKLSTKLKKAYTKADRAVEDFMDETNLSEVDTKAGEAVDYVADKAKKTGEFIANKSKAVANTGSWIKKHHCGWQCYLLYCSLVAPFFLVTFVPKISKVRC